MYKLLFVLFYLPFILFSSEESNSFSEHIKYSATGPNEIGRVYIGPQDSMIDESTRIYVKSALDHYKKVKPKPSFIILELNTPGGVVVSAGKIADSLKKIDLNYNIPVVAFIDNWALSAGARIAYSCRYIAAVEDASMGAAEPVLAVGTEMKSASEKINSALRADFSNAANYFDRNPLIAKAMVDKDVILVMREGKIIELEKEEDKKEGDVFVTKKGKLLTLNGEDLVKYKVADISLETKKIAVVTEEEMKTGKWSFNKSLLSTHPFFSKIPNATVTTFKLDWKLLLLSFLSKPAIASLLFLGLMLGFYLELNSPGFGLAGSVALACLSLIIISHFTFEVATWLEVLIILIGVILLGIEVFVLPGFGFTGVLGGLLCVAGLFLLMLPSISDISFEWDSRTFNAAGEFFLERLMWLCGTLIVGVILMVTLARYVMPRFFLFQRFVLAGGEEDASNGFVAGEDKTKLPPIGSRGVATTLLRPSGKVEINGEIYDAMTNGEFIQQDENVVVDSIESARIIVGKVTNK